MGMMKQLMEDYCIAIHPNDDDKQVKLFEDLCNGIVKVTPEKMSETVNIKHEFNKCPDCDGGRKKP